MMNTDKIISVCNKSRTTEYTSISAKVNFWKLLVESKCSLFTVDAETLAKGACVSNRNRETDYKTHSATNATGLKCEELYEINNCKNSVRRSTLTNFCWHCMS